MRLLSVGLTGASQEVLARLENDCSSLLNEGFRIAVDEIHRGQYIFIGCNIVEGELSFRNYERIKDTIKSYVASIITDTIILKEEKLLIIKIIEKNYNYFNEQEKRIIYERSLKILDSTSAMMEEFNTTSRRKSIFTKLLEYLDTHHELVVDGFIKFRMKEYRRVLTEVVDRAADELMMDLEYKEFIRVLRYFVNSQESDLDEVHLILKDKDIFKLFDSEGKIIKHKELENYTYRLNGNINYEDLLITALITISPLRIIVHNMVGDEGRETIETIKNIFEERVGICLGCEFCRD